MINLSAAARACSNIAFIKYWGNQDDALRIPVNGSLSMNLQGIETTTKVTFSPEYQADRLVLNGVEETGDKLERLSRHLDHVRALARASYKAEVISENNFPTGAGIASSASAFSALSLAAAAALGLRLSEAELSRLARLGSGSASRSIPGGFVEWLPGTDHESSYAFSIAPADHWPLVDLVTVLSTAHKAVGSTGGHRLAPTSPLQAARTADTPRRLDTCREAVLQRDFARLAEVVEEDALLMHAVMMTSKPPLIYWEPPTLAVIDAVRSWREIEGLAVCFTIDAGANVHVITPAQQAAAVLPRLEAIPGVQKVITGAVGGPAVLIEN